MSLHFECRRLAHLRLAGWQQTPLGSREQIQFKDIEPSNFSDGENAIVHLSSQGLLVIVLVGIVAGWLAGHVIKGRGFGLIGDLLIGLVGAFVGDWLLPALGIHVGVGIVALIFNAFVGAVFLLLILRLLNGSWGYRRHWSRW